MSIPVFAPLHINASYQDLEGNGAIGRYVLLPGSNGRAKYIADHFEACTIKAHPRAHDLYLGKLSHQGQTIDVATIATGMGCPSMEIILHELFHLGAKRFLRIGTAGGLQSSIQIGDIVFAKAAVRDESTTLDYVPKEFPAIASFEWESAFLRATNTLSLSKQVHAGIVHCKSSFYAREFGAGPMQAEHERYTQWLKNYGVLATEMETSSLFVQSQIYNHRLREKNNKPSSKVLAGALLGIMAIPPDQFATETQNKALIEQLIQLSLETVKTMAVSEK